MRRLIMIYIVCFGVYVCAGGGGGGMGGGGVGGVRDFSRLFVLFVFK